MFWHVHVVIWFLRAMIFSLLLLFLTCKMELGLWPLSAFAVQLSSRQVAVFAHDAPLAALFT